MESGFKTQEEQKKQDKWNPQDGCKLQDGAKFQNGINFQNGFRIQNGILVTYELREEIAVVPEGVHTIGEDAFKACVSLKKIVLPGSLRRIMPRAFKGCRNLCELKIPEGVSYIGDYAFHRCHSLEKIQLPVSVGELGNCVFLYCDSLKEAWIPGVTRLGRQAFLNDTQLLRLVVSRKLEQECIRDVFTSCGRLRDISFPDGERFVLPGLVEAAIGEISLPPLIQKIAADVLSMFELEGHCLARFLTNLKYVEIPEGIEQIGKSCFFDRKGIVSVSLPASLKEIKSRAFRNCINLKEVFFAGTEIRVEDDAFRNCTSLYHLHIPGGRKFCMRGIAGFVEDENAAGFAQDGVPKLVRTIKDQILGNFRLCGTVLLKYLGNESRVAVPDGVTAIAEEAFAGKEEIDRILLPDSLLSIGAGAFRGCLLLQTIVLPPAIKRIGAGAFENCVKLLRISLPETIGKIEEMTFRHCRKLKQVNFGAGLLEIGEQAFYGCASLTEIVLPDGLLEIGAMAFYRCRKLSGIELPASLKRVGNLAFAQGGVEKAHVFCGCEGFGTGLFSDCTHLNTLCLHKGVRHIPDKMASGCGALSRVELPGTVCSIGRNTVERTAFLEAWKEERQAKESGKTDWMGGDSTDFSGQIFWDGSELNGEVEIPGYYHMVAGGAFYGNHHITSVALSGKITFVGGAAFKGCSKLSRVVWPEGIHDIQPEVFSGCAALTWIQGAPAWRTVGDRAFYGCKKLSRLCMDKMEIIGKEAFFGCSCFQMGEAERVRMVGEAAFDGTPFMNHEENRGGKEAVLPALQVASIVVGRLKGQQFGGIADGVTRIAPYAFYRDPDIVSLRLPESVCLIGEGAFLGCDNLKEIIFPVGNCRIEARAFEKCTSLKRIRLCSDMVGERAFAWCTSLLLVEISGAASVGRSAFEGCKSLEEFSFCERKESGGECRESDDWKEAGNPDRKFMEIEIADSCFCGCGKLHTIDLVGVSMIGRYAFSNCDSLKRIVLSCDTPVAPYAFADCGRLMEICISGGREGLSLQEYALSGCTALRRVCFEKDKVSADRTGEDVPSIDPKSGGAGIRIWEFQVFKDLFSEKIPESIRMIFYSALSCFEVEDERILYAYHGSGRILKIPSGIEQIKAEVFRDQTIIEQVSIPESVEYIGARAFHGTAFIEGQKERSPMVIINQMLLDGSSCVGRVIIPPQIKRVCGWAFANGMGIKEICFTSRFVRVEEFAFRNCINLEKIELPGEPPIRLYGIADRERELPPVAKQIVTERLNCFKTDGENALIECTGNITKLLVADGITRIGENVFRESNLMTEIILPPSVTSVGKGAFFGCKWLKTVRQPLLDFYPRAGMEGKEDKPQSCGIREIADMAFANCGRLEYIELSNSFQRLGKRAFEHCTALMEVYLPEGIEEIPERTFFRCHSLKKVVFPSTLKRIGKEAFAFCGQLEFAGLPDGVMIGERAFVR